MSTSHAILPLSAPVLSVDEQVFLLPPAGNLVPNRACKLLFFFEVNCEHWIEESPQISRITLQSGDIMVLPHWCHHRYMLLGQETQRVHAMRMLLDPEVIPPLPINREAPAIPRVHDESLIGYASRHFSRMSHLKGGMTPEINETIARLRKQSDGDNKSGYRFRAGAACIDLIVLVARQLEEAQTVSAARLRHGAFRVEEAREFIIKHLETPLSLELIANQLKITPEHLARVWKATTGTTLFDFVRQARIEKAKTLLTASEANISEIALACGFSSLALFSRTFKRETGFSPGQYRERLAG